MVIDGSEYERNDGGREDVDADVGENSGDRESGVWDGLGLTEMML